MKLALDTGHEVVDPTAAQVEEAIRSAVDRREGHVILSHSDAVFIQAAYLAEPRGPGGGFLLEYSEGAAELHYRCDNASAPTDDVVRALLSYLAGRADYKHQLTWLPLAVAQRRERSKVLALLGAAGLIAVVAFGGKALGLPYAIRIAVLIGTPIIALAVIYVLSRKRAAPPDQRR